MMDELTKMHLNVQKLFWTVEVHIGSPLGGWADILALIKFASAAWEKLPSKQ
jgi:hypothetical protein